MNSRFYVLSWIRQAGRLRSLRCLHYRQMKVSLVWLWVSLRNFEPQQGHLSKYETLKPYKGKTCITHPEILRTDELGKSDILEGERAYCICAGWFYNSWKKRGVYKKKGKSENEEEEAFPYDSSFRNALWILVVSGTFSSKVI